ncbi:type I restriction enzyme R subunit [Natronocella acetinitrilica]|uniref:Type I restriction enzyme endonuclease subunit n=1 Tax=Natronocella acetinitrilica TaxID=414046 RepID=A0AAE3G4U7_9GAMM|nr:type I restriction endonuclease subunit R [Natronocella acetinitrilica]MCP1674428.1 type I restriction enzyme R subunit [Natronocella acetinitrilica]
MTMQSELDMEKALVDQLGGLGYEIVEIRNEPALVDNFKAQIEAHNKDELAKHGRDTLSRDEFDQLLNTLNRGSVFDRAKQLRGRVEVKCADGVSSLYLELLNTRHWCQNRFQVARQITNKSASNHSRYDVTILINGLPLVQMELKAPGSDMRTAFDQIDRYRKTSYSTNSGLFDYIQLFVISNGVDTRYFSNNAELSYQFTFEWADEENQRINRLSAFVDAFMERCHLSKMIARYVVLHETTCSLLVLRPYQYYAVERILERVACAQGDGYVWHTTGSGKTLTSFKASQILSNDQTVDKVVFVVDRRDLDYQTALEFNAFSANSVDTTEDTGKLVAQLNDPACKLIVTTIQKLNAAITRNRFRKQCEGVRAQKFVFIFDECHRSQFGETHQRICDFFTNRQMFGFTGTPIFDQNISDTKFGKRTTEHLFGQALHRYVITDAIRDRNVLRFSIEYRTAVSGSDGDEAREDGRVGLTPEMAAEREFITSPQRIGKVADDIIRIHESKTHQREYTAMLCVANVEMLQEYYTQFKEKKLAGQHTLRLATIFSCARGESGEFSGVSEQDLPDMSAKSIDASRLAFLQGCIDDYNALYGASYRAADNKSFYEYYQDVSKRVRRGEVDVLLVVNMFLTGFDSKALNTLYVDKNLRHHGLIQAFSRTNRVFDAKKSHGNIVCYRDLKEATDEALSIFANRHAKSTVLCGPDAVVMEPYADLAERFRDEVDKLKSIAPTVDSVGALESEEEQCEFIVRFREVLRLQNTLKTFHEYCEDIERGALGITTSDLVEYQSKYLDLREDIEAGKKAACKEGAEGGEEAEGEPSMLANIDFEVELIRRDEVTVGYILGLIEGLRQEGDEARFNATRGAILDTLQSSPEHRAKRALFQRFIDHEMPHHKAAAGDGAGGSGQVLAWFNAFADREKTKAILAVCDELNADFGGYTELYRNYVYQGRLPDRQELLKLLVTPPRALDRVQIAEEMRDRMREIAKTHEGAELG